MNSPLQLKKHWFTEFSVEAIPTGLPEHTCVVKTESAWGHAVDDELNWRVDLKLDFGADTEFPHSPYRGKVTVVGFFQVSDQWPADGRNQLVRINGASMLYGAIREMVLMFTGRSTHGPLTLPTMSFAQGVVDAKAAPTKEAALETARRIAGKKESVGAKRQSLVEN